jgi:hypothetical protein
MEEIKENLYKCRDTLKFWIRRLNIIKMSILFDLLSWCNIIKILANYLLDINKLTLKLIWEKRKTQNSQYNTNEEQSKRKDTTQL